MEERDLLTTASPANVGPVVLRAMAGPTLLHVSGALASVPKQSLDDLWHIFNPGRLMLPPPGTGTLAAEIALANLLGQDDSVLPVPDGYLRDRL